MSRSGVAPWREVYAVGRNLQQNATVFAIRALARLRCPSHPRGGYECSSSGRAGRSTPTPPTAAGIGVLLTGLLLGIRHGIDWDHIAAITDITSTTAAATAAEAAHAGQIDRTDEAHQHGHGGHDELQARGDTPATRALAESQTGEHGRPGWWRRERERREPEPRKRGRRERGRRERGRRERGRRERELFVPGATVLQRWFRTERGEAVRLGTLYAGRPRHRRRGPRARRHLVRGAAAGTGSTR